MLRYVLIVVLSWYCVSAVAETESAVERAPHGDWIKPLDVPAVGEADSRNGVSYLLVDRQIRVREVDAPQWFNHYADHVTSELGLTPASKITVSFDPSYQRLTINQLIIRRGGKIIDKLPAVKISVIQREKDLEQQIYDGTLTANINVDDVRVGDIVESAYTLEGENPIFSKRFSAVLYAQGTAPVREFSMRLLWQKREQPKRIRLFNSKVKPTVKQVADGVEYVYRQSPVAPVVINSESPGWYDPLSRMEFSNFSNWGEVVNWALPIYEPLLSSNPTIRTLADDIRSAHTNKEEQVVAALQLVQGKIRYLGMEMGIGSHQPSAPHDTWTRRYGDCKDKSVLFVSILRELQIDAHPALVNTDLRYRVADRLPSPKNFNHVITRVALGDEIYWLDPTRPVQFGDLKTLYQPRHFN